MLQQTFIHIPGIGKETERELWKHGIRSWDDADRFEKRFGAVGARLNQKLDDYIPRSRTGNPHRVAGKKRTPPRGDRDFRGRLAPAVGIESAERVGE